MAHALGVERSTYSCYEAGRVVPGLGTLKKLAGIFHIPAEAFLYPEEFTSLENTRLRAPKKLADDPETIGQLTPEEKALIALRRIKSYRSEDYGRDEETEKEGTAEKKI